MFTGVNLFWMSILLGDAVSGRDWRLRSQTEKYPLGALGVNTLICKRFHELSQQRYWQAFVKNDE
jgi:hypothetical protein